MKQTFFTVLFTLIAFLSALAQDSLTNGLVAYYSFNGDARDGSGFGRNGIVTGATLGADRFGVPLSAYSFDGVSSYIAATSTINDVLNSFTTSMWFNTTEVHKEDRFANFLIAPSHGQATWGGNSVGAGISAGIDKIKVWEHTSNYRVVVLEYAGNFSGWNFVTLVYSNRVPSLFVNGAFVAQGGESPRNPVRPSNGESLPSINQRGGFGGGQTDGGDAYFFKGSLDDIRIYNRALASDEVAQIYAIQGAEWASLNVKRAIYLDSTSLQVGTNYQLQVTSDFKSWTNHGEVFTATNSMWRTTNYWDVENWNSLFFRLHRTP